MPPNVIAGRYRIGRPLGEGGMGAVFEAEDVQSGARVAVKIIARELRERDAFLRRFEREAAVMTSLASKHIAAVLATGVDEESGNPFIVMELLRGEDLGAVLRRVRELPTDVALRIALQVCAGLERAHAAGVVHRDVKPSNLFLARDGDDDRVTVKLLDFGIAKVGGPGAPAEGADASLTQTGAVLGSPLYMSPEQARGSADVDHRADLWSLGVVLYQALSGRTPKEERDGLGSLIVAICTEPATPVQDHAPWVPRPVASLVRTALSLRREARFQSAAEMRAALAQLVDGDELRAGAIVGVSSEQRSVVAERTPADAPTAVDAPAAPGTVGARARERAASGPCILVVEDNEMNMDMLSRRLARKGYRVLQAVDGESGVAIAKRERPDLVLMDIGLPGMDGWEAVRTLRDSEEARTIPIIALTAHASGGDRERALEVGCADYETKPVELARLLKKIEALLA